jgi:plastocyanin
MRLRGKIRPWLSPKVLALVSVACFLLFVFSASRALAATTVHVKVGGETMGPPLAKGGMVWFNGYDPADIIIHPGDTVTWDAVGGVHTVTSVATLSNGSFVFDSSPLFTLAGALSDMGPGKLLAPGSVYDLDTTSLPVGTYKVFCRIHPGMQGNVTIATGPAIQRIVNAVAGWGDHVYAVQAFAPENISVPRGTIIRWTLMNPTEPHTITLSNSTGVIRDSSPNFNPPGPPPVMIPGTPTAHFSWTFNAEGTYVYFCKLHAYQIGQSFAGMMGTVHVVPLTSLDAVNAAASGASAVGYGSLGLSIVALLVAVYGVVRKKGPSGGSPPQA